MLYNTTTFTATEDRQLDRPREKGKQTDRHRPTETETGTDRMLYNTTTFTATEDKQLDRQRERDKQTDRHRQTERLEQT